MKVIELDPDDILVVTVDPDPESGFAEVLAEFAKVAGATVVAVAPGYDLTAFGDEALAGLGLQRIAPLERPDPAAPVERPDPTMPDRNARGWV